MKPQTRKPYPLLPITGPQMQPILKNMLSHCWTVGSPNLERQEAAGQILLYNFPKNKDKQHFNHHTHHLEAAIGGITVSLEEARNGVININKIYCSQVAKWRDYFYCKSE